MSAAAARTTRVLTFGVGGRTFAIEAASVAEVLPALPVTRVPQAPAALQGIANVRGRVAPIVALDRVLDDIGPATGGRIIVLGGETPVGLAVDVVNAMREVRAGSADAGTAGEVLDSEDGPLRLLQLDVLLASAFGAASARRVGGRAVARSDAVAAEAPSTEIAFLEFRLCGQAYALRLDEVREVCVVPAGLHALPGSDAAMLGLLPLRDRLLPVVSAASVLGLPVHAPDDKARIVVVVVGEAEAGLLVDEVHGVLRTPADRVGAVPSVLNRAAGEARIDTIVRREAGLVSILEAARVLDQATIATLLAEGAGRARVASAEEGDGAMHRFLLFRLGGEAYGLPIEDVDAVIRLPDSVTRVPGAPPFVAGVINHRGRVTPLVDQSLRFATPQAGGTRRRVILTSLGGLTAGFIVDAVEQIVSIPDTRLQPTPDLATGKEGVFDRVASIEHDGRLVLLVDPRQLLDQAERDILQGLADSAAAP